MAEKNPLGSFREKIQMRYQLGEPISEKRLTLAAEFRKGKRKPDELFVFLHGLGCNKDSFRDIWEREDFRDWSILVPDFVGFGDSLPSKGWTYTLEDHARSIKKLLESPRYKGKTIHLVGHSTGGSIGILLAEMLEQDAQWRNKLSSVTLLEPNLIKTDSSALSRSVADGSIEDFEARRSELVANLRVSENKSLRLWANQIEESDPEAFQRTALSLVKWSDSGELLKKFGALKTSKVYVHGNLGDRWKNGNKLLEEALKGNSIRSKEISGTTHFIMTDEPNDFYGWLAQEMLNLLS